MGEPDFVHDFEQARRLHGALWAAGDYTRVAEQLTEVSAAVVNAAGVLPGMRVLDMGAGSGNTALLAADRGAEVTAMDLTDDLFRTCRRRTRRTCRSPAATSTGCCLPLAAPSRWHPTSGG